MSEWITEVCEEGVREIWMQCDASRFPGGVDMLEQAAWGGDPEGWYFLGVCNTLGDGGAGFHKGKAYDCYIRAVRGGSCLAVLGAIGGGKVREDRGDVQFRVALHRVYQSRNVI